MIYICKTVNFAPVRTNILKIRGVSAHWATADHAPYGLKLKLYFICVVLCFVIPLSPMYIQYRRANIFCHTNHCNANIARSQILHDVK